MDKVIVYKNDDGSCAIIYPAPEMFDPTSRTRELLKSQEIEFENDQAVLDFIINKDVPAGKEHRITTPDKIPTDRTYRNAWTDDNPTDTVDVDMTKAKEIHMNHLRSIRNKKLAELDVAARKASGNPTELANIDTLAQTLRDIPQTFDLSVAGTPEALKLMIPDELK